MGKKSEQEIFMEKLKEEETIEKMRNEQNNYKCVPKTIQIPQKKISALAILFPVSLLFNFCFAFNLTFSFNNIYQGHAEEKIENLIFLLQKKEYYNEIFSNNIVFAPLTQEINKISKTKFFSQKKGLYRLSNEEIKFVHPNHQNGEGLSYEELKSVCKQLNNLGLHVSIPSLEELKKQNIYKKCWVESDGEFFIWSTNDTLKAEKTWKSNVLENIIYIEE